MVIANLIHFSSGNQNLVPILYIASVLPGAHEWLNMAAKERLTPFYVYLKQSEAGPQDYVF